VGFKEDMVHLGTCTLPATTEGFGIYVLGRQHVLTILQEAPCHLRMLLSRNASVRCAASPRLHHPAFNTLDAHTLNSPLKVR
jgi:hypothetical protein